MKVLSLFSGIGAFEKALTNLGINFELIGFSEIDKYAPKSYCAIHGVDESLNLGDITKIDETKLPSDIDLITYGFPCQDISIAGYGKGLFNEDGSKTRSGLFFDALRIIEATKPKIAIAENVKNLTSKRFKEEFQIVLDSLYEAGYHNYWKVLNAKDFGIPQNREIVFIVSIRKDVDNGTFEFPEGLPLKLRLKDMLEEKVADNFYLSDTLVSKVVKFENDKVSDPNCIQAADLNHYGNDQMNRVYSPNGISPTVLTKTGGGRETKVLEEPTVIKVGNVNPSGKGQNGNVIDSEGLARTVTQEKGEGQKILVRVANKKGYQEAELGDSINFEQPSSTTRRGRVGYGVAQTLNTGSHQGVVVDA